VLTELLELQGAKVRAEIIVPGRDSHGPFMRAKMAALLALLNGKTDVTIEEWEHAGILWDTSCAVRDAVEEYGAREKAREREERDRARVQLAERTAAAVSMIDAKIGRLAETLAARVANDNGLRRGEARRGMRYDDRHLYDTVVERADARGLLRCSADGLLLLPPLPAV
jgi:hypothetical protein